MCKDVIVGVPFYDQEEIRVFEECQSNLLKCLDALDRSLINAKVVFVINGPQTSSREHKSYKCKDSRISLMYSDTPGQVSAINYFAKWAKLMGYEQIFVSDADIYRRPECIIKMLEVSDDVELVGARHEVYPLEYVEKYVKLSNEEKFWYLVFEGDKNSKIFNILQECNFSRFEINKTRIKGSLMRISTDTAIKMHGNQTKVSDSVINQLVNDKNKFIVDACYFHMGRVSLRDHVVARLRHYNGVKEENLHMSLHEGEVLKETEQEINFIAKRIRTEIGEKESGFFLLRCALRNVVADYCLNSIGNVKPNFVNTGEANMGITNYSEAVKFIESQILLLELKSDEIEIINGIGTTQTLLPRYALNFE